MCKMHAKAWLAILLLLATGCNKENATEPSATTPQTSDVAAAPAENGEAAQVVKTDTPETAISEFLDSLQKGMDDKATMLLSKLAREKTASLNRRVTPPASDTAKFTVGEVKYLDENRAAVKCTWTDYDEDGQLKTDEPIWVLRKEPEGWRVAGLAVVVFPDEPPVELNFEEPEEMFKTQQWVDQEIRRRMAKESAELQAQESEKPENSLRR